MWPFLALPVESDATVRAAVTQSTQLGLGNLGTGSLLFGGQLDFDLRVTGKDANVFVTGHGDYAQGVDIAPGYVAPSDSYLTADASANAEWTLSPRSSLFLDAEGSLATTYGVRADTALIELDPFAFAQRLEAAGSLDTSYEVAMSPRSSLTTTLGWVTEGAFTADVPTAKGVDMHEGHGELSESFEIGPRDTLTPSVRYAYSHFFHALKDTSFHRTKADIHALTLTVGESHALSTGWTATLRGGATIGSPMPLLHATGPVVAPEINASTTLTTRALRVTGRYRYAYTSLGPRIGFGDRHTATGKLSLRPLPGAANRDLILTGIARFSHGVAPLAADPTPSLTPTVKPSTGTLRTTSLALGTQLDYPLVRGLAATLGLNFIFVRGHMDDTGTTTPADTRVVSVVTLGVAGTLSTDPQRTVPRDPEADREQENRRQAPPATEAPSDNWPSPELEEEPAP